MSNLTTQNSAANLRDKQPTNFIKLQTTFSKGVVILGPTQLKLKVIIIYMYHVKDKKFSYHLYPCVLTLYLALPHVLHCDAYLCDIVTTIFKPNPKSYRLL